MPLKPDTLWGQPRLVGDDTAETVTLSPGQLANLSLGAWLLGGDDTVTGSSDAEFIVGNQGRDFLTGLAGADSLFGGKDDDLLQGGEGNDLVRGDLGDDLVAGDEGNDVVRGGRGNDKLLGNSGNDALYGDIGTDNLTGGEGNDTFVIPNKITQATVSEPDTIEDFKKGEDLIALTEGLQFENLKILPESQNPNNALIQKDTGELLAILKNVNSPLERSDFLVPGTLALSAKNFTVSTDGTSNTVTVTRTGGSDGTVSATLSLKASGAFNSIRSNGFDNTPITVSFASGDMMPKTLKLPIINDGLPHYPRTVALTLENPTGIATLGEPNVAEVEVVDVNLRSPSRTLTPTLNFGDSFGNAIAASGNKLLVGSFDDTAPVNGGIAYLFDSNAGTLLKTFQKPTGFSPNLIDPFGRTVAIANNKVLIGSPFNNNPNGDNLGAAFLFDADTGAPLHTFRSPNPTPNDKFGESVAFVGNNVLIGAPGNTSPGNPIDPGVAYLFDGNTNQLLQTFRNPNPEIIGFGQAVVALGNNVAIAAPGSQSLSPGNTGAAYSFDSLTGQLLQTFRDPNPGSVDLFGSTLLATGNDILIGSPLGNAAYRFNASTGALTQTFSDPTANQEGFNAFGSALAIADNDILIGAPGYERGGAVFQFNGATGNLVETYLNTRKSSSGFDDFFSSNFGTSLAIVGDNVAIGASGSINNNGAVFLY